MPKLNTDDKSLFEPIEITLEGKQYVIEKITATMLQKISEVGKEGDKENLEVLCKQMAILLGGEPKDYMSVDIRKLSKIIDFIIKEMNKSMEDADKKNSPEAKP